MKLAAGALLLPMMGAPAVAAPITHCGPAETVVFSCVSGNKTLSICGSGDFAKGRGRMQYRYGPAGKPEFVFPDSPQPPQGIFKPGVLVLPGGGGAYLQFTAANRTYTVFSARGNWGKVPGIRSVVPLLTAFGGFSSDNFQSEGLVHGIGEADLPRISGISRNIDIGTLQDWAADAGIVIGRSLADELHVGVGGHVSIAMIRRTLSDEFISERKYRVSAIYRVELESSPPVVFMPLAEAESLFHRTAESGFDVSEESGDERNVLQRLLEAAARGLRASGTAQGVTVALNGNPIINIPCRANGTFAPGKLNSDFLAKAKLGSPAQDFEIPDIFLAE